MSQQFTCHDVTVLETKPVLDLIQPSNGVEVEQSAQTVSRSGCHMTPLNLRGGLQSQAVGIVHKHAFVKDSPCAILSNVIALKGKTKNLDSICHPTSALPFVTLHLSVAITSLKLNQLLLLRGNTAVKWALLAS